MPYVVSDHFDELISKVANSTLQEWISQIWIDKADADLVNYCTPVQPVCEFLKATEEIGLVYFIMPAPRTTGEVLYSAIVFLINSEALPSAWLRRYFTLEVGAYFGSFETSSLVTTEKDEDRSVRWTFAEWDWEELGHLNKGKFPLEPTLENFLAAVVREVQNDWY